VANIDFPPFQTGQDFEKCTGLRIVEMLVEPNIFPHWSRLFDKRGEVHRKKM
jgi:hypothetical protein